jgi:hypothetical protein
MHGEEKERLRDLDNNVPVLSSNYYPESFGRLSMGTSQ